MKKAGLFLSSILSTVLALALVCSPTRAGAVAPPSPPRILVTKTATVTGTVIHGSISITNIGKSEVTITSIEDALEARFPKNVPPPLLEPSATQGWFLVATTSLPLPGPIPPHGAVDIPYSVDTCDSNIENFDGAKYMRNVVVVTAVSSGSQKTRVVLARTPRFAPPSREHCPTCGNGIVEANEQCDGGACCSTACQLEPNGAECSDGNSCTVGDSCVNGQCVSGALQGCGTCDTEGCTVCVATCATNRAQCLQSCWDGFLSCINGCTTTYCAPFCQADLSRCLASCPTEAACRSACETTTGCANGCTQP